MSGHDFDETIKRAYRAAAGDGRPRYVVRGPGGDHHVLVEPPGPTALGVVAPTCYKVHPAGHYEHHDLRSCRKEGAS